MQETVERLEGPVTAVVFQNTENGYSVIRLRHEGEQVTAVGIMPGVTRGVQVELVGEWMTHPSYGPQFRADHVEQKLPSADEAVYDYLASGIVKGIGPKLARRLVDRFGGRTLEVIESHPEELTSLKGMSLKRARAIQNEFLQRAGMRTLLEFLADHAMPPELGVQLWRQHGPRAIDLIRADPYLLVEPELGVRFAEADQLAESIGVPPEDPQRIEAGIHYVLTHNLELGHVFLPEEKLLAAAGQLLSAPDAVIDETLLRTGLQGLEERGMIHREAIAGVQAVYRIDLYEAEAAVAERISEMCQRELRPPKKIAPLIHAVEKEQGITYAPEQRAAVELAARTQIMLLTGGPGTGKTTSLRGILGLFDALGLKTSLAAPTGRAAKRLSELCGVEASTIHRLLEAGYDPSSGSLAFSRDEDQPLDADAVIVDEVSMVDLPLMASLLAALKNNCRLVLVGDPDQLPSVGPGQLFDHLIRSGVVPMVRLTEIFRQAQQSDIVMNAHAVNQGHMPVLTNRGGTDCFFLRRTRGQAVLDTIVDLCQRRLPEHMDIPASQIQVLTPTRKYLTGTASLNQSLQAVLNPPAPHKTERKFGNIVFREGDRVMQVKNNYDLLWRESGGGGMGVFNGDIGVITSISKRGDVLTVSFEGREVDYAPDQLNELELAYAMTVHKSQGSEYRAVVLAAVKGAPMLLTRGVLYTAITRAKDLLIIVGDDQVIAKMVANNRQTRRYTGLRARLRRAHQGELPE